MLSPDQIEWSYKYNKDAIEFFFNTKMCFDCQINEGVLCTGEIYIYNCCFNCRPVYMDRKKQIIPRDLLIQEIFTLQILRRN